MALTAISIGEERATNTCCSVDIFKKKKKILKAMTLLKDIAYFSENGVKMII